MMVLCGQSNQLWHYLAGAHPGRVGYILGPSYYDKVKPRWWMPYALDNDAFMAWASKKPWNEIAWVEMLDKARMTKLNPLWILVPDVVADKAATIESWNRYFQRVKGYGWDLAFACQDGMTPEDVPDGADLVFIGGTTEWKWRHLPMWCSSFNRVHVGRVNTMRMIRMCESLGVESVDGSGWFRDTTDGKRANQIVDWIKHGSIKVPELNL